MQGRTIMVCAALVAAMSEGAGAAATRRPNVVVVTVDTLRADHMSAYGYGRPTTPHLDRLLASGVRFDQARTVEPLTNPALSSMLTSLYPHEHGATRNGLRMRPGLLSLGKVLGRRGYTTAAFVGNWTLNDELSGLSEHFDEYHEVHSRKRWWIMKSEATADDLTAEALDWIEEQAEERPGRPFLLWLHYVEPHAPYRLQETVVGQLGLGAQPSAIDRYDSEIAYADRAIGRVLAALAERGGRDDDLVVFAADHGESLGENTYWGHGRNLHEPNLRIPLGFVWPGRLRPGTIEAAASLFDVAPTVLGLLGLPLPDTFRGFDWSNVLLGRAAPPRARPTYHQAHKGAVQGVEDARRARRRGLIEVGVVYDGTKVVLRSRDRLLAFDVEGTEDDERLLPPPANPPRLLEEWLAAVTSGLTAADALPVPELDEESARQMRALGYTE